MRKMNFANNLKEIMREHCITQQEVAVKVGVSQRAVSKWIRGETEPTATNIFNLSILFEVSADYLLGLVD